MWMKKLSPLWLCSRTSDWSSLFYSLANQSTFDFWIFGQKFACHDARLYYFFLIFSRKNCQMISTCSFNRMFNVHAKSINKCFIAQCHSTMVVSAVHTTHTCPNYYTIHYSQYQQLLVKSITELCCVIHKKEYVTKLLFQWTDQNKAFAMILKCAQRSKWNNIGFKNL